MTFASALADRLDSYEAFNFPTPGDLALALYPRHTVQTPALELLDRELVDVAEGRNTRLMFFMPPQEGKSQRVSRWFPLWLLLRNPELRIVIASYEHNIAKRWGRAIRDEIKTHPELGLRLKASTGAAHEWELDGHSGGVFCTGVGGPLTGRPADLIIIDDPVKGRAEADSPTYRETAKNWWAETVSARLGEGAPVVLVMTRWHMDDLAGWLQSEYADDWRVINIPALAETGDILGRAPGEWLLSARARVPMSWEKRRRDAGSRGFQALYQGRPAPDDGNIFRRSWWKTYTDLPEFDQIIQSWDMTFKDTKGSDYVVGQVWGRLGSEAYLLDQIRDRLDFPATCNAVQALSARWPNASIKLIEDKANGPAVISQLRRSVSGLIPINPKDSKLARASAVSPFVEAGNVYLPESAPWLGDFIVEAAMFPNGAHDDQVDAMSQALHRLLLAPQRKGPRMYCVVN